jgi:hypothetical protein
VSYSEKERREAAREKAIREAKREFNCPTNIDANASYRHKDPRFGAAWYLVPGERWLRRDLIQMYPESGCPAVRYEREDLTGDHSGISIRRMLELMNAQERTFAPIWLYCPEACGETLDTVTLYAHASRDFRIGQRELDQLSAEEFSKLVDLWNRRERDEVRAEAIELRDRLLADPDQAKWTVIIRALAVFTGGTKADATPIVLGKTDQDECKVWGRTKPRITAGQYKVVKALLEAQPERLSKHSLESRSGIDAAINMIDRLRRDQDWADALDKPGKAHGGYGIRKTRPPIPSKTTKIEAKRERPSRSLKKPGTGG